MGGVDKAALRVGGVTLLDRVLAAARPVCDRLLAVGPVRATVVPGVQFVGEATPGGGPVPAVATGLAASGADTVLVLAADLPLLSTADLQGLLDRLAADPAVDAVAAMDHRGLPNPLLAAYRGTVLDPSWGPGAPASALLPDRLATVDLGSQATLNVNVPADLERAVALLRCRPVPAGTGSIVLDPGPPGGRK